MKYAISGMPKISLGPSISDLPSVSEKIKKISSTFVETLSLGRRDSFKNKIYEEYLFLLQEKERLTKHIAELELKISFLGDVLSFVDCLSLETTFPSISGDVASDISLEWLNENGEELILTFKSNGKIIYS